VTEIEREADVSEQCMLDHTTAPYFADGHAPDQTHDPVVVAFHSPSVPATFCLPRLCEVDSEAEQQRRWLQEFLERHKDADDPSQWVDLSDLTPEEIARLLSS
jgi:hypothetical protein